jgi:hypothetical protein
MKKIIALLILVIICIQSTICEIYTFSGKKITDETNGISITESEKRIIIIDNFKEEYSLFIPFSDEVTIKTKEGGIELSVFYGSLFIYVNTIETKENENTTLMKLYSQFDNDRKSILMLAIKEYRNQQVIKTIQDVFAISRIESMKGYKQVNYYNAKSINNKMYSLQYSIVINEEDVEVDFETSLLHSITEGMVSNKWY